MNCEYLSITTQHCLLTLSDATQRVSTHSFLPVKEIFPTRKVECTLFNGTITILGQNPGTESCPLIALANCLAIRDGTKLPENPTLDQVVETIVSVARTGIHPDYLAEQLRKYCHGCEVITPSIMDCEVPNSGKEMEIFKHFDVPLFIDNLLYGKQSENQEKCLLTTQTRDTIVHKMNASNKRCAIFYAKKHYFTVVTSRDPSLLALETAPALHECGAYFQDLVVSLLASYVSLPDTIPEGGIIHNALDKVG